MSAQASTSAALRLETRQWPWLVLALSALLITIAPIPGAAVPGARELKIVASQYEFSPGVITVNQGDHVSITLASSDVVHGLFLDGYELEITADPGQTATLSFVADKPGVFHFRCSATCGPLHPFMIGKLRVGPNALLWRGAGLALLAALAGLLRLRR